MNGNQWPELLKLIKLKRFLTYIYKDKAYDAFNDWVDDQIIDFGEEYFMLEV